MLERIGVKATIRSVEDAQFQPRLQQFDFDMVRRSWGASLSPGNEQLGRWSQAAADRPSSFNYAGAKQPAIDAMIDAMLAARTPEDFVAAVRALDRVLISGYYVDAAVLSAGPVDRPLDADRASGKGGAHRLCPADMVGGSPEAERARRGRAFSLAIAIRALCCRAMTDKALTIDVISDVVCPWCYLGKRRLARAIDLVPKSTSSSAGALPPRSDDPAGRHRPHRIHHRQVRQRGSDRGQPPAPRRARQAKKASTTISIASRARRTRSTPTG